MICILCWAESRGATMTEAAAVLKGETVCSNHLQERAGVVESALGEDAPRPEPH